jgi:8-oxo-dGTP pyrophosphatase MutT (NUDIX family)
MAYITHGHRLLVFRQPDFPEAGIQTPGGTMDPDEDPADAVLREAFEETGLAGLEIVAFLGTVRHDLADYGQSGLLDRHYFHLSIEGDVAETWHHLEMDPSEGDHESVLFELFWVDLPDGVPPLIGDRGEMVHALLASMGYR